MKGDFGIDAGSFTKSDTQEGVNCLSRGALGEEDHHKTEKDEDDPETVLSDLKGHILLRTERLDSPIFRSVFLAPWPRCKEPTT